jgi:hypothetical protein
MNKKVFVATGLLCATAWLLNRPLPPRAEVRPIAARAVSGHLKHAALEQRVRSAMGSMPLQFVENPSQANPKVKYLARGGNFLLALSPQEAAVMMHTPRVHEKRPPQIEPQAQGWADSLAAASVVRVEFAGARADSHLTGLEPQKDKINYIVGNDPSRWQRDMAHFSRVRYEGIYPGIDAVFHGARRQLEYDFVVAPGADPSAIRMRVEGAASVELTAEGGIVARTPAGNLTLLPPRLYQRRKDSARGPEVAGRYVWSERGEIGFQVASYDRAQTLVIDPLVNVSRGILATPPPPGPPPPTGDAVALSTLLGGTADDSIQAIAIGATSGHVYVTGFTDSGAFGTNGFPLVGGEFQDFFGGFLSDGSCSPQPFASPLTISAFPCGDAFVAEFDVSTISAPVLVNTTYLGGSGDDVAWGMALDANDNVYVVGETDSGDFPTTNGTVAGTVAGYQQAAPAGSCTANGTLRACHHVFFSKLDPALHVLLYSTYLAGTDDDEGYAVAVGATGQAFLTGVAGANFPTIACSGDCAPYQASYVGGGDVFVAEINPTVAGASGLTFSTYLGGDGTDIGFSIALDSNSNAYIGGVTYSTNGNTNFPTSPAPPTTPTSLQPGTIDAVNCGPGGFFACGDGFVAEISSAGTALLYSTFLGGSGADQVNAIALDGSGNIYATGQTNSGDFVPVTIFKGIGTPFQSGNNGGYDAFVVKFTAVPGANPTYATYLGGNFNDFGLGIAFDGTGDAYVSGSTSSPPGPSPGFHLLNPLQANPNSNITSFVSVLNPAGTSLLFSTYFGGLFDLSNNSPTDVGNAIALDSTGRVYLAGRTTSLTTAGNVAGLCLINPVPGALTDENDYADYNGFLVVINPTNTPAACFSPSLPQTINFGGILQGKTSFSTSTSPPLTIYNQGSAPLVNAVSFTGANPLDFAISDACNTFPPPPVTAFTVPAGGGSCQLSLTFTPSTTATESANLVLTNGSAGSPFTITLMGTGLPAATETLLGPGSTTPLAFGNVTVNTTSALAATLTNTSAASPLDVNSASLTSAAGPPSPDFTIASDGCSGITVPPSGSCMIMITYAPKAVGAATPATSLSVASDGATNPITLMITGAGVAGTPNPPFISLPTFPLTFVPQTQGTTSAAQNVTITNTAAAGSASLNVALAFNPPSNDFLVALGTCANPVPPANGTCTFMVSFKPTTTGPLSANLQITSNASNGTQNIGLNGTGLAVAMASPSPASLAFPPEPLSTASAPMNLTLTNTGGSNLTVTGLSFTGTNPGDFTASGCTSAVAANNSCTIVVTFTPQPPGPPAGPAARSASLQIASNASNGTQNVNVSGMVPLPPTATPSPSPLNFPAPQVLMTTSAPANVTLSNSGGSTLTNINLSFTTGNTADFGVAANGCGTSLGAGGSCVVAITFTPQATGPRSAMLQFSDSLGMQNVMVNGTGVTGPTATLAPAAGITFATPQQVNTTSATMAATLTNSGGAPLTITGITTTGDFSAVSNTCGISLAANSPCSINVAFTPTMAGTRNGALMVMDALGTQMINLTGTGFTSGGAQASLSSPLYFGAVIQGSTSPAQMVTITNTGGAPLTVMGATASAQFGVTNNCTTALATGQSCMVSVTFVPTGTGTINGTLVISDNAPNSPQSVSLSGLGATFSLAPPTGSPSTLTINPGDTANFSVGLTSTPGLVLPLTLACTSNAPYTICTVNPSSVTLGGPSTPVVTVTLQTNCVGQLVGPKSPASCPFTGVPAPLGALWAAVLLLFALGRRPRAARGPYGWAARLVPICAVLVLVLLVVGFAACVSNNPPAIPGSPTTPAGTYNITVTANGQNITKQLSLIIRVI